VRPTYQGTPGGKIAVEAKRAIMRRTKKPSPNRADAFLLTLPRTPLQLPVATSSRLAGLNP
jgi:hypothetical protein